VSDEQRVEQCNLDDPQTLVERARVADARMRTDEWIASFPASDERGFISEFVDAFDAVLVEEATPVRTSALPGTVADSTLPANDAHAEQSA
jgi:hypothetical protein